MGARVETTRPVSRHFAARVVSTHKAGGRRETHRASRMLILDADPRGKKLYSTRWPTGTRGTAHMIFFIGTCAVISAVGVVPLLVWCSVLYRFRVRPTVFFEGWPSEEEERGARACRVPFFCQRWEHHGSASTFSTRCSGTRSWRITACDLHDFRSAADELVYPKIFQLRSPISLQERRSQPTLLCCLFKRGFVLPSE